MCVSLVDGVSVSKKIDLTGQRYGRLEVIEESDPHYTSGGRKIYMWECRCDCGNTIKVSTAHLRSGHTVSCGCKGRESLKHEINDLVGKKFGRLTVVEQAPYRTYGRVRWKCVCDCGNHIEVDGCHLTSGHTKSCGCLRSELSIQRSTTHGGSNTKLYKVFLTMIARCENPNNKAYCHYGGVGIKVCDKWRHDFSEFREWSIKHGYTDGLTIDRIDNSKGYSPDNCRWVDWKTQQNNRTNNRIVFYQGLAYTLSELSKLASVNYATLKYRLDKGWEVKDAMFLEPNQYTHCD